MFRAYGLGIGILLGVISGFMDLPLLTQAAQVVSDLFIKLLKLISLPVISFSLLSTLSGIGNSSKIQILTQRIVKYTIFTTLISASVALGLYLLVQPNLNTTLEVSYGEPLPPETQGSYLKALLDIIPSNILSPFVDHNVLGVLFITLLFSFAIMKLPDELRVPLNGVMEGLFRAVMSIIQWIVQLMPLAVWAFITLFAQDVKNGFNFVQLAHYFAVIIGANLIQAFVVLPLLLKRKKIAPFKTMAGFMPALSFAFFSKSSVAAMPIALECAEKQGISSTVARFSYPLCTSINMNACAAFILTTVLFVGTHGGIAFSLFDKIMWVGIATIAAIGNAGVPMGCFFLASALLTAMGAPITLMGIILPFYALLDMLESAINIWSDSCVTALVDKD